MCTCVCACACVRVLSVHRQRITTEYHVYPSFGKRLFFELKVTNPFSREDTFVIHAEDPRHELRVVTDSNEWRFLRRVRTASPSPKCGCCVYGCGNLAPPPALH